MYNETLRWDPYEQTTQTAIQRTHRTQVPSTLPLQPFNGLNVLDLPRPARGGLVLVEMLFAGCRRWSARGRGAGAGNGKTDLCCVKRGVSVVRVYFVATTVQCG